METRASKRKRLKKEEEKKRCEANIDRISALPDDLLHRILSRLYIKTIAETCVLSKRWNSLWTSFPVLDFSNVFPEAPDDATMVDNEKVPDDQTKAEEFLTNVLSRRKENSNIKLFRVEGRLSSSCLHTCIPKVVKHRVEELVIELSDKFNLPLCVFQCDSLKRLILTSWRSYPSPLLGFSPSYVRSTAGLRSLHTLFLMRVDFLDDTLAVELFSSSSFPCLESLTIYGSKNTSHMKISCPNLKDATLSCMGLTILDIYAKRLEKLRILEAFDKCENERFLNIFAPNLQHFKWHSEDMVDKCSIQSFPTLKEFNIYCPCPENISTAKIYSAACLLSAASQVQKLGVSSVFFKILSKMKFRGGLPYEFMKLETLTISTNLGKAEIPGVACLFKSSPTAHTLNIHMHGENAVNDTWDNIYLDNDNFTEEQYWRSQARALSPFLGHLKVVKIEVDQPDRLNESVIKFVKLVLEYGKGLEEMIIRCFKYLFMTYRRSSLRDDKLINVIQEFPRACPIVKISIRME